VEIRHTHRLVVKLGSASLEAPAGGLDQAFVDDLARQVKHLLDEGWHVVIVSSGAVRSGLELLGLDACPSLTLQQAVASVGQSALMNTYGRAFKRVEKLVGQVLLARDDLSDRKRYLNARACFEELLELGVVPIVNENDTVAVEELCFGDNDQLAARVAALLDAELLVLLSDVDGLYQDAQRKEVIPEVEEVDEDLLVLDYGKQDALSRGGLRSKLEAARLATRAGVPVILARAREKDVLVRLLHGEKLGTHFKASARPLRSRKRWLAYGRIGRGELVVNEGARKALAEGGKSLLAAGLVGVKGDFHAGDLVDIVDEQGGLFARGLVRYSAADLQKVLGMHSRQAKQTLGEAFVCDEVVHRDDMVINP